MTSAPTLDEISRLIQDKFPGVVPIEAWGELSFFYNPGRRLKRGAYFATLKTKDGENDKASNLNRDGAFRLYIGVEPKTYEDLFGPRPQRPAKGCAIEGPWDFARQDILMPHPVYAWIGWVCVLNPSEASLEECLPLIVNAHSKAKQTFIKRARNKLLSEACLTLIHQLSV